MDFELKALVLSAADFAENDKLAVLLTDGAGKIRVKLRGVKKADARLKFAAQPFCFMDASVHRRGEYDTLTGALPIELFYDIVTDLDRMYAGCVILEAAAAMTRWGEGGELLACVLSALKSVCYADKRFLRAAVAHFLSRALILSGYELELDRCIVCGKQKPAGAAAFDLAGGGVKCVSCGREGDRSVREETVLALKKIRDLSEEEDAGLADSDVNAALSVYNRLIEQHFGKKLHSVSELMRI